MAVSLAFDGSTPYVAYQDEANDFKATVMKFDGSSWVNVGSPGFSAGAAYGPSLAFDGSTPYVAYSDEANNYKATVMKFDGTNWVNVGSPGFSPDEADYTSLVFNGGTPYIAFADAGDNEMVTVMKFIGSTLSGGSSDSSNGGSTTGAPDTGYGAPQNNPLVTALIISSIISACAGLAMLYRQRQPTVK